VKREWMDRVRKISLIWHMVFNEKEGIQLYDSIFYCAKVLGALPFEFNPQTQTLTPITSGPWYCFFLFNMFNVFTNLCKATMLIFRNWWTNFEEEEFSGGYFAEGFLVAKCMLIFSMAFCYSFNQKQFGMAISSCIQIEAKVLTGGYRKLIQLIQIYWFIIIVTKKLSTFDPKIP